MKSSIIMLLLILSACDHHVELVKRWSNDGSVYFEEYRMGDKLHGIQKWYDSELHLKCSYSFNDGVLHGPSVEYGEDGDTLGYCNFVNGVIEGEFLHYNHSGDIIEITAFTHGQPNGVAIRYFANGAVRDSGAYDFGVKRGLWCSYDSLHIYRCCEIKTGFFP